MSKKRVLFVGADQQTKSDFLTMQNYLPGDWEVLHAEKGAEALQALKNEAFDSIVSEMALPDMKGTELLGKVTEEYPATVRFILSEQADRSTILEAGGNVHQFIARPLDPETLAQSLNNSVGIRSLLNNDKLQARIAGIKTLPSLPDIHHKLTEALNSGDASPNTIASLISRDIGITAKLLQMVNSAYFGLSQRVESVLHATNLLGLDTVQSIVLSAGVFDQFRDPKVPGYSLENIYNQSLAVGAKSRMFAVSFGLDRRVAEDSLMAGMLYDVGKLLMLTYFQPEFVIAAKLAQKTNTLLFQAETEVMGVNDAMMGASLLALWGLPDSIVEAVGLHYTPSLTPNPMLNALTATHLAYALNSDGDSFSTEERTQAVDAGYLAKLGLENQLSNLRNLCQCAVA